MNGGSHLSGFLFWQKILYNMIRNYFGLSIHCRNGYFSPSSLLSPLLIMSLWNPSRKSATPECESQCRGRGGVRLYGARIRHRRTPRNDSPAYCRPARRWRIALRSPRRRGCTGKVRPTEGDTYRGLTSQRRRVPLRYTPRGGML